MGWIVLGGRAGAWKMLASDWLKGAPPPLPTEFDYVAHPTA
jgi:hypothetical protein